MVKFKLKQNICPYCKKTYNKWKNMLNHIKKNHNEIWIKDDWYKKEKIYIFGFDKGDC